MIVYGWRGYATLTERPGLDGDMYWYYRLTRPQFYSFNFTVALVAFGCMFCQVKYLVEKNPNYLVRACWIFLLFFGLLILTEVYLGTGYVRKG